MEVPFKIIDALGQSKEFYLENEMALSVHAGEKFVFDMDLSLVQLVIVNDVDLKIVFADKSQLLLMNATQFLMNDITPFSLQFNSSSGILNIATYESFLNALQASAHEEPLQSTIVYNESNTAQEVVDEKIDEPQIVHLRTQESTLEQFIDDNESFVNGFTQINDTVQNEETNDDLTTIIGEDGADIIEGTTGDDAIDAGRGNDIIDAGSGDDVIDGGKGKDTILAGEGDDTIVYDSKDSIDGSDGFDTLLVEDVGKLDISKLKIDITNIEEIDMQNGLQNQLKNITIEDVLTMTDENKTLYITGDEGDSISFKNADEWVKTDSQVQLDDTVYDVWTNEDFTLNIDTDLIIVDI